MTHMVHCFVELQHTRAEDILDILLDSEVNTPVNERLNDENGSDTEVRNERNSPDTEYRHERNTLDTETAGSLATNGK